MFAQNGNPDQDCEVTHTMQPLTAVTIPGHRAAVHMRQGSIAIPVTVRQSNPDRFAPAHQCPQPGRSRVSANPKTYASSGWACPGHSSRHSRVVAGIVPASGFVVGRCLLVRPSCRTIITHPQDHPKGIHMSQNPLPTRKQLRAPGYDYATPGLYMVMI